MGRPNRPGKNTNSSVILSVRFTEEEVEVIRHLALYHRLTTSELVRRAVLERHALGQSRMTTPCSVTVDAA